jgi:hypothetical protein
MTPKKIPANVTKGEFLEWLDSAESGSKIVYFEGASLGLANPAATELAKEAREQFAAGRVELCQKRIGKGFEYLAIKRKQVRPPMVGGSPWRPYLTHADQLSYCPKWAHLQ